MCAKCNSVMTSQKIKGVQEYRSLVLADTAVPITYTGSQQVRVQVSSSSQSWGPERACEQPKVLRAAPGTTSHIPGPHGVRLGQESSRQPPKMSSCSLDCHRLI